MKHFYKILQKILLFLTFLVLTSAIYAQDKTITGIVTDASTGEPIPGATIVVKGSTSIGTITQYDGKYSLDVPQDATTLVYSFVGMISEEIQIGDQSTINVTLVEDIMNLQEVIVIGYGVQKKEDKTGAVATINSEDMIGGVLTDPIQGIQGKSAGVLISKKGGDPSKGFSIKIRGASGFDAETEPLFIIDGVPGADPTTVAPEDILSFNILKDAASTAIYGSRGSNGVIIITTRKGEYNSSQINFNSHVSFDQVAKKLDLLSADELRQFVSDNNLQFIDGGGDVDWQDEMFRTGISQNYNLSFSGGNEASTYYASLTRSDWEGVMKGTEKQRTIGKLSVTHKGLDDKLTLSGSIQGTFEENDYENYDGFDPDDVIFQAIQHNPTDPVYDSTGDYYKPLRVFNYENPMAIVNEIDNVRSAKRFLGNFKADYEFVKGLTGSVNFGYIRDDHENSVFRPKGVYTSADNGYGQKNYENNEQMLFEATGNYTKTINDVHNLTGLVGYSWQESQTNKFKAEAWNPQSDFVSYNNLGSFIDVNASSLSSEASMWRLIGFFSRVQYNYDQKYYMSASIRRDGSSKFGKDNQWGYFPTVSLGWDIHDESFMDNLTWVEQLKLRVSYGISGNQEIGEYRSQVVFEPTGSATDPETGELVTTFGPAHNANPKLKWERTKETNVGIDFGFLNNRVSGTLEVYNKLTDDLLGEYQVPVPPNLAQKTFFNSGSIKNQGIELYIQAFMVDINNFKWKTSLNAAHNTSTIESLGDYVEGEIRREGQLSGRGLIGDYNYTTGNIEGEELGAFYLPVYVGLSDDGVFLFESTTGGITRNIEDAKRQIVGSPLPNWEVGWSNSLTFYRNWTLDFTFRSLIGNDVYNATRMFFDYPGNLPSLNAMPEAIDWYNDGRTSVPTISDLYVENGSFVKLDYISLGYNLPTQDILWLSALKVYVASNNLFTITKYTGVDPETEFKGLSFGVDKFDVYPKTRTLTFGVSATF